MKGEEIVKAREIAKVYETYDYNSFKRLSGNRKLTNSRLEKLIASFKGGRVLCPITVNSAYEIIDGQGRYDACKFLKLPIHFVVDPDANINDCRRMNHYNSKWTVGDFITSYQESGNENYKWFAEAVRRTKLSVRNLLKVAGKQSEEGRRSVETGSLIFTEEDLNNAIKINEALVEIKEALCITDAISDSFKCGVIVMMKHEKFNLGRMIDNCRKNRSSFTQMAKLNDMLVEFSRIYNYRHTKEKLYFEDYMRNRGSNVRDYSKTVNTGRVISTIEDVDVSTLNGGLKGSWR